MEETLTFRAQLERCLEQEGMTKDQFTTAAASSDDLFVLIERWFKQEKNSGLLSRGSIGSSLRR